MDLKLVPRSGRLRHALVFVLAACGPACAASFDCTRARAPVEKAICSDAQASDLDEVLARYYHGALAALKENASCLRSDQQAWIRKRNECADSTCLRNSYRSRLTELSALQPGINTQRKLALPPGPVLVWVMAPERVVSPRVASTPAEVRGTLSRTEDGTYLLRDAQGKTWHVVDDLIVGEASGMVLQGFLAGDRLAAVAVKGHVAAGKEGNAFFDHRHCTFVYRLPN